MMAVLMSFVAATTHAQTFTDAEQRYIVKTANAADNRKAQKAVSNGSGEDNADDPKDFFSQRFRYVSLCDWNEGMRFMVMPNQKDLVVKTFAEASTGRMVPSTSLRHKIMVYKGHSNNGGLHERMNFVLEEDTTKGYYYEVPTASFADYCYSKTGVPTLAYLGDVDTAIRELLGKQVRVLSLFLYQDTEIAGDGVKMIDIHENKKQNEVMTIVKVGVGTRNFPVKIIVKDRDSIEYFQNVAISRTNSGMRDEEFEMSDMVPHTFVGSFELLGAKVAVSPEYKEYIGKAVYSVQPIEMRNEKGDRVNMSRMSAFTISGMQKRAGSDYVTLGLTGKQSGKEYTVDVLMVEQSIIGTIAGAKEEHFSRLFAFGDPLSLPNVKKEHLNDIRKGIVKAGFTEEEVKLALGEPSDESRANGGQYKWTYQFTDRPFHVVYFNSRTKKVTRVTR
ncbi:MAG: hypothetical protein K6G08_06765 [Prevotella sp.]|nr:hypothetical protein [Prevotella sp.]